jgi:hypothetical protein
MTPSYRRGTRVIAIGVWQGLLDAIGWLLARIYDSSRTTASIIALPC